MAKDELSSDTSAGRATTPAGRDPFVDLLRVTAVMVVVFGHWFVTSVFWDSDSVRSENALSVVTELHLATWLVQVMPLLFFVGGFSNSVALARREGVYLPYLNDRFGRLLRPTFVFFGVWLAVGVILAIVEPSEPNVFVRAAEIAAIPVWFLGLYLMAVALAPSMIRLHRRLGLGVPVALASAAVVVDVARLVFDVPDVGALNYAFVWLFAHQLGFFYSDGSMLRLRPAAGAGMALTGLAGLVVLTRWLGYPMSMVGVPGEPRWNTDPPGVPLLALTLGLVGLALLLRPLVGRGNRPKVTGLNSVALTVYLWHLSTLLVVVGLLFPLGFPQPATGSVSWWMLRPVWLAALAAALMALVRVFRRFEVHPQSSPGRWSADGGPTRTVVAGFAVYSLATGVLGFGVSGFANVVSEGAPLLVFSVNASQNALHVTVGAGLLWATRQTPLVARWVAALGAAVYLTIGALGWNTGLVFLGLNRATAVLHVVVGVLVVALLGATAGEQRFVERSSR